MSKDTYSSGELKKFRIEVIKINNDYKDIFHKWQSLQLGEQARNYANYGFMRRLGTLRVCIHKVYDICPPEIEWLDNDIRNEVEVFLHSFVVNVYGALDNLAHILNFQLNFKLGKHQVGFFPSDKYKFFISRFSEGLRSRFTDFKKSGWEDYLLSYRHSLAHRIPLYVPPEYVTHEDADLYKKLESEKYLAISKGEFSKASKIDEQVKNITRFEPLMLHDLKEEGELIFFHAQMLQDWKTVHELALLVVKEIQNSLQGCKD